MAKKKRERRETEVLLSDRQKYLQAQWIYHQRNSNAKGLDTTDVGTYLDGIIKFTSEFMLDTSIPNDLREWAQQLNAGAKAASSYLGGKHEDAVIAGFILGMIWEQFKFHAGPLAEAVRGYSDTVFGAQQSLELRLGRREKVKVEARRLIRAGRTDVLGSLVEIFRSVKYARKTLADILREVRKEPKKPAG